MEYPKISIITPSFNQSSFIEETINSVITQDYPNLEYIIVDGGSTDGSVEIIKKYEKYVTYWISERDKGQTHAINKGMRLATGEVLSWLASDDYLESGTLKKVGAAFCNTNYQLVNGNCTIIENGKPIKLIDSGEITLERLMKFWIPYSIPPQPSIFFRKKVWDVCGPLDELLNYSMDYQLWLRAALFFNFKHVNENFSYYRFHHNSKSCSGDGLVKFVPEWEKTLCQFVRESLPFKDQWEFFKRYSLIKCKRKTHWNHFKHFAKLYFGLN